LKNEEETEAFEKGVVGTTFEVYLYLLKVRSTSEREVYHSLEMSSPYLATYHLNKLLELKLVNKDATGAYKVNPRRFGILRFFTVTGKWVIPRTFFYTILYLAIALSFLMTLPEGWNVFVFGLSLVPAVNSIVETKLFYKAISNRSTDRARKTK